MSQDLTNPFIFEKDYKKFIHKIEEEREEEDVQQDNQDDIKKQQYYENLYQQSKNQSKYGIIRALHDEALKIAKERDEMFARDHTLDPVMHDLKHFSVKLIHEHKDQEKQKKNYRIRNILKEKRETIAEYVNKKREIFLSNMNITIKKEETARLEDFIKNEQESLRARQLYFKNDCELVRKFMNEVKIQADKASERADGEAKKKEIQKDEMTQINTQNERLRIQKTKLKEEYDRLLQYKEFIEKLQTNYQSIFDEVQSKKITTRPSTIKQENSMVFVTDVDPITQVPKVENTQEQKQIEQEQQRMAELLIEILNHIQEKNLQYIQNQHDSEEELEAKKRELKQLQEQLQKIQTDNAERLRAMNKQIEVVAQKQKAMLEQLNKVNSSKLQFSDGEDLDMERIGKAIIEIQRDISKEAVKKASQDFESKDLHRAMTEIEQQTFKLLDLRRFIIKNPRDKAEFFDPLEKKYKQQEKRMRQMRTQNDDKVKLLQDKLQKKEEYLQHFYKGRKPMYKWFINKKTGEKKQVVVEKVDDDEKYLDENYELGFDEKQVAPRDESNVTKLNVSQQ